MRVKTLSVLAVILVASLPLFAQHEGHQQMTPEQQKMMEAYMKAATPGEPHRLLEPMIGTWDAVVRFYPAPGEPPQESTGISENRWILGNRYVEQRFKGSAMGQPFEGIGYTGYDNVKKQYFGSWIDSMSTSMMTTTGKADSSGKNWTFTGTMDDAYTGKTLPLEEKVVVVSNDKHYFEMWNPGPDGKNYKSMEIIYTRKK
jgi:hypothetical protein